MEEDNEKTLEDYSTRELMDELMLRDEDFCDIIQEAYTDDLMEELDSRGYSCCVGSVPDELKDCSYEDIMDELLDRGFYGLSNSFKLTMIKTILDYNRNSRPTAEQLYEEIKNLY